MIAVNKDQGSRLGVGQPRGKSVDNVTSLHVASDARRLFAYLSSLVRKTSFDDLERFGKRPRNVGTIISSSTLGQFVDKERGSAIA